VTTDAIVYLHVLRGIGSARTLLEHETHMEPARLFASSAAALRKHAPPAIAEIAVSELAARVIGGERRS
jgi:hypothetical protein